MIYPQTVSYAIEALGHLAGFKPNTFVKVRDIAVELDIPEHFLGKVLSQLVRKKLLLSSKGPTGGISLGKDPKDIVLHDILEALDVVDILEDNCILGLKQCTDNNCCPFHEVSGEFKRRVSSVAKKTTLAELAKK